MRLTWQIVHKDLRRLRVPLALWSLLLVAQILIGMRLLNGDGENLEWFGRISLYGRLFVVLDLTVTYVLAAVLIQEDAPVGSQVFWLTRPISGARLLGAKVLGGFLMFGVLPVLIWLPWWLACDYGWRDVAAAIFETLAWRAVVVAPAAVLAAVTDTVSRLFVRTLVLLVAFLAGSAIAISWLNGNSSGNLVGGGSRAVWAWTIFLGGAALVTAHQYLTRRTRRTLVLAGVGTGVLVLAVAWAPAGAIGIGAEPAHPANPVADQVGVRVDGSTIRRAAGAGLATGGTWLDMRLTARGVPDDLGLVTYWRRTNYFSRHVWTWPDGTKVRQSDVMGFGSFENWEDAAARRLLGIPMLQPDSKRDELMLAKQAQLREGRPLEVLLNLPEGTSERMVKEPPAYVGRLNFLLVRPEVEFSLPLPSAGRRRHDTETLRIAGERVREDGRMFVNLVESRPDPRTDWESYAPWVNLGTFDPKVYALVDERARQAVLIPQYGSNLDTRVGTVDIRWNTLAFAPPLEQRDGRRVPAPPTWFAGATLVRVGFAPEAHVVRELKLDPFKVSP